MTDRTIFVAAMVFAAANAVPILAQPGRPPYIPPPPQAPPSPPPRPYIPTPAYIPPAPHVPGSTGYTAAQHARSQMDAVRQQGQIDMARQNSKRHHDSMENMRSSPGRDKAPAAKAQPVEIPGIKPRPLDGIVIVAIDPKGLAAMIGLEEGDVLAKYGGRKLTDADAFLRQRDEEAAEGRRRGAVVWRNGRLIPIRLPPGRLGVTLKND